MLLSLQQATLLVALHDFFLALRIRVRHFVVGLKAIVVVVVTVTVVVVVAVSVSVAVSVVVVVG